MNALQYAIASIVEANTGYGLPRGAASIDYADAGAASRRHHAQAVSKYLQRTGRAISVILYRLRKRRELRRSLRQLSNLSDRLLEDIGFTRGDISAAQSGKMNQAEFEQLRIRNLGEKKIQQRKIVVAGKHASARNAINEAVFEKAKCA